MMYLTLFQEQKATNPYVRPQVPATNAQLQWAQEQMGLPFPVELCAAFRELNGDLYLFLSTERLVETNQSIRDNLSEYYDGLDQLLFVAENGCGDYYCYRIEDGTISDPTLYIWYHEDNAIRPVAGSLLEMFRRYFRDEI